MLPLGHAATIPPTMTVEGILAMPYKVHKKGYALVRIPECPSAWARGDVRRSHAIWWSLGRPVLKGEVVHHLDEDKLNDDPSNHCLMDHGKHTAMHKMGNGYRIGQKHTAETKARMSSAMMGNKNGLGIVWTDERREKTRLSRVGKKHKCSTCGMEGVSRRSHEAHSKGVL